jgi:hypothetical integral membrane protein (TIGR02206 family)
MTPTPFQPFGALHLVTVALIVSAIGGIVVWARRAGPEAARKGARALAVTLVAYYAVESVVRVAFMGVDPVLVLPFELCNALFFIGAYALWTDHRLAQEVVFFWTFGGTVHSLITPTPGEGFPSLEFVRYFAAHGLLVLVAVYVVLALEREMTFRSLLRAFVSVQLFEIGVGVIDWLTGLNFLYLRYPPPSPTLFDALGPWPYYLLSLEVVAFVSFALWLGVLTLLRRAVPRRASAPVRAAGA